MGNYAGAAITHLARITLGEPKHVERSVNHMQHGEP
jgi:hypothetical protein